ncbi:MAG: serine/threonine-protein kinase [Paludisphaera borealis]|uniref:serine/threonine-protein kinase n=1 Tax=Paludisphaera borealis TaxID=1387353 RepID=UPI0028419A97|nr:serine/threonine-protein kinase [Paludisphaera borealis]MDR3623460.1 serine/threonine-protein kinase [Paludisphaera borealis]
MSSPVRVVCRGCLRSVEIGAGDDLDVEPSGECPFCGQPLDSRSPATGSTADGDGTDDSNERNGVSSHSTSDWVTTWSRGSLGSLGRFQLRERLGDGGFGEVFLAYDPRLDRDVALKVLRLANPSERVMERFFREARAAARLDHPNIVAVHDAGFDKGRCWVAYHHISGRPLWWCRDHHPFDPAAAARILRELADAVDHAHQLGVLHRDIKPANILIDDHGRPRLIDFGLARRSDLDSSLTHDGAIVGTPAYMSPEQALGLSRQVDERSDVFSLGVIFFEILAGRRPGLSTTLATPNATSLDVQKPNRADRTSPHAINPAVPPALNRICMRAMADKPDERYPTARALADDLDVWLHRQEGRKRGGAARKAVLAAGLVLLSLTSVASGWMLANVRPWGAATRGASPEISRLLSPSTDDDGREIPTSTQTQAPSPTSREGHVSTVALGDSRFVGNLRKKRYHLATCDDVKAMAGANIYRLKDLAEAVELGLKPCDHCQPDSQPAPQSKE